MKQGTRISGLALPVVVALVALVFSAASQAQQVPSDSRVRDSAILAIRNGYALLFEHLGVTPSEQDALVELLVEDRMGRTASTGPRGETKRYGKPMTERKRSNKIASIIGNAKLQQFLTLEENLSQYGEIARIGSMLQQNDVPLTNTQRDELFEILLRAGDQQKMPPAGLERSSIEYIEYLMAQRDEYERYVMQLAPSVLTPEQVVYLDEQYRYLSYARHRRIGEADL